MEEMLKQSSVLQSTWEVYQSLLKAMEQNSPDKFLALITEKYEELHPQMRTCLKTLNRNRKEIANTLKFGYTNAVTEAINNHIKVLKRVSDSVNLLSVRGQNKPSCPWRYLRLQ